MVTSDERDEDERIRDRGKRKARGAVLDAGRPRNRKKIEKRKLQQQHRPWRYMAADDGLLLCIVCQYAVRIIMNAMRTKKPSMLGRPAYYHYYVLRRFLAIFAFMMLSNGLTLWLSTFGVWRTKGGVVIPLDRQRLSQPQYSRNETQLQSTDFGGVIARSFDLWPASDPLPCYEPEPRWFGQSAQTSPASRGLFFMKPYKTGSSTAAGIHLRIAKNQARRAASGRKGGPLPGREGRFSAFDLCRVRFDHAVARYLYSSDAEGPRERRPGSFLWTVIRDPTDRAVSQFFHFIVGRHKVEPSDRNFRKALERGAVMTTDYYLYILTMDDYTYEDGGHPGNATATTVIRSHDPIRIANGILAEYDFIGITERFDESIVALQMLLGLSTADVLYLSAKHKGSYDDGGGKGHCDYIWPSFVSSGMRRYFASDEWHDRIRYDSLLYRAANRSLDLTIDEKFGRSAFERQLSRFVNARRVAQEECFPEAIFPCSEGGEYNNQTNCIWNDSGCGNDCLDRVATELNLW